jgi:hypothetical protein
LFIGRSSLFFEYFPGLFYSLANFFSLLLATVVFPDRALLLHRVGNKKPAQKNPPKKTHLKAGFLGFIGFF